MSFSIPLWAIVLDYILGVVMWTLIGRTAMRIFLPENSAFFFMRFFVRSTDPLLKLFRPITPEFRHPDKAVMVKSILDRRCARCHSADGSDERAAEYPLEKYEQIVKHIEAKK